MEPPDLRESHSYAPDVHRMLPQSPDAELGLLGSILLCPAGVMGECIEKCITPEHFHVPAHGIIYGLLREMHDSGHPIDFILLTRMLRDRNLLDKVGGPAFVTGLFTFVPTAANANYYLEILKEKRVAREIIVTCNEYGGRAYEEQHGIYAFLDQFEARVGTIGKERAQAAKFDIKQATMDALGAIEAMYERKGQISGLSTGFKDFDHMTDGMHPAEMIVIAGRPSSGKTSLAMNIAEHVAIDLQQHVGVFSLEMSTQQLMHRIICSRSKVNMQNVRDGFLSDRDFSNMSEVGIKIAVSKLLIDDTAGLTILEARARARKWKREKDIKLIVIDYLQLLKGTTKRALDNRHLEIGEVSSGIKALAKELGIPIIALAQLNRDPEKQSGGRPRLANLRESGNIEQDADLVGLLYREEMYAEGEDKEEAQGKATLIIAKQRNGPVDDVPLTFLKEWTRFEDRAKGYEAK